MDISDRYLIGQQSFEMLRMDNAIYVDKTMFIPKVAMTAKKYMFLARPRRFGKSLFLSTLKCFFEAKRHLFEGLYINNTDWKWEEYPVLYLDFNLSKFSSKEDLNDILDSYFTQWETKYNIQRISDNINVRFKQIIEGAHLHTGRQVVILVDEYDKPLVGNINRRENFNHYRDSLQSIYSNLKNCADHIRLAFLTGVSRFSKLSIFFGLNNILDISFLDAYADICGITENELESNFHDGISQFASHNHISYDEAKSALKKNYDGYRFAKEGSDIYNPWSVLNALNSGEIINFWNQTGVPSLVAEILRKEHVNLRDCLNDVKCSVNQLSGLTLDNMNPLALLFQGGYLTIKDYDSQRQRYHLGIPNREVKEGLMDVLLPLYVNLHKESAEAYIWKFIDYLEVGDAEEFMKLLQSFFAGITYELKMENENNLQNALYVFMALIGLKVETEVRTSDGRIDLLINTAEWIYIIELKYDATAEQALSQIDSKEYPLPFSTAGKQIIKIGAAFDKDKRRIISWKIA